MYCLMMNAQELIHAPGSLILVYNSPDAHFYLKLEGKTVKETAMDNVFILDDKVIQVIVLNKDNFMEGNERVSSTKDFIQSYIDWELQYLNETFSTRLKNSIRFVPSGVSDYIALWSYDMPVNKSDEIQTESSDSTSNRKQMFAVTSIGDYIVGVNSPLFEAEMLDEIQDFLFQTVANIIRSDVEINAAELGAKLN